MDERLFKVGAFMCTQPGAAVPRLLEVLACRALGHFPTRKRVLTVEDAKTLTNRSLVETELKDYDFVQWAERWRAEREADSATARSHSTLR